MSILADFIGAYAIIPARDVERAKQFYEEKIGLPAGMDIGGSYIYDLNGSVIYLYETDTAGTGKHTILSLYVTDLRSAVTEMKAKGVTFEEYDTPYFKTVNSIANMDGELAAWFVDTEGNTVLIGQRTQ